jgi:hypothetical protein
VHGGVEAWCGGAGRGSGARVWGSCGVGDEMQGGPREPEKGQAGDLGARSRR